MELDMKTAISLSNKADYMAIITRNLVPSSYSEGGVRGTRSDKNYSLCTLHQSTEIYLNMYFILSWKCGFKEQRRSRSEDNQEVF